MTGWNPRLIPVRWWTRRCRGCADSSPHDSHLTWLGRKALGLWLRHPWRCLGVWVKHDPDWRPWRR